MSSVASSFAATAAQFPTRPFLHVPRQACSAYAASAIDLTYGEAQARIDVLRRRFEAAGIGAGHRVAVAMENRAEFFLTFLALNALRASVVPVQAELGDRELLHLLQHSDAAAVLVLDEHRARFDRVPHGLPVATLSDLDGFRPVRSFDGGATEPGEEAALLYTSGTSGQPKGCVLSNAYFHQAGLWYVNQPGICALRPGQERLVTPLPVSHSNALAWSFMATIRSGGCLVQLDRFHPSSWWDTVRESRATVMHYLGVMPAMLLKHAQAPDERAHEVRFGFGAGVDPRHHAAFEARFGIPLIEAWAMTETGAGAVIAANEEPRHVGTRCFGRPGAEVEVRIVGEDGADLPAGTPGELLVRSAGPDPRRYFFSGYYKDHDATDEAWRDGWFHTGDVVRSDAEGQLFFVDRRKNVIRRSGENIASVEVEGVLAQHPAIRQCAVAPVVDEIRGEEVFAAIVLADPASADEATARELCDFVAASLVYYKVPGYVAFVDALPMTASQKIQRGELKRMAGVVVETGGAFDLRASKRRPKQGAA